MRARRPSLPALTRNDTFRRASVGARVLFRHLLNLAALSACARAPCGPSRPARAAADRRGRRPPRRLCGLARHRPRRRDWSTFATAGRAAGPRWCSLATSPTAGRRRCSIIRHLQQLEREAAAAGGQGHRHPRQPRGDERDRRPALRHRCPSSRRSPRRSRGRGATLISRPTARRSSRPIAPTTRS